MSVARIPLPDIRRDRVVYENPLTQHAIAVGIREYYAGISSESSQEAPSENLVGGADSWLHGSSVSGGTVRNKLYVAEVLRSYAHNFRTPLSDLTSENVWYIAQQEAAALLPGLHTFLRTSSIVAHDLWNNLLTKSGEEFDQQRLLQHLQEFLYFSFMQVVMREDIRTNLGLNTADLVGSVSARQRIHTVHPSSVVGKLVDGVTLTDVSKIVAGLTVPLSPGDTLREVASFVTAEGLLAKTYEGETAVVVRYSGLESAMYEAFTQVLNSYDSVPGGGVRVSDLTTFRQHLTKVTSRAYDTVLGGAAYKRMLFMLNHIYASVLPGMEEKRAALKVIHKEIVYLRQALGQMVESGSLSTLALGGRVLRNATISDSMANMLEGPASFVCASGDESGGKYIVHLAKALSVATGLMHVQTHIQALRSLLDTFFVTSDGGSRIGKISEDEKPAFDLFERLRQVLRPANLPPDSKGQVDYLKDVVACLLEQADAYCTQIASSAPHVAANLDQWRLHMLGFDPSDSVLCRLAELADESSKGTVLFHAQGADYGYAPHSLRFAVNGMDSLAWKKFQQSLITGLWTGKPFGEIEPCLRELDLAIAQVVMHFPIHQKKVSFPQPHANRVLRDPDSFLGVSETSLPHRREVPVYLGGSRSPVGYLVYALGTVGYKEARGDKPTEYAST